MFHKPKKLINYKGNDITISELATISGKTYGAIAAACSRHPQLNGDEIIALKSRKEATFKGKTKSLIEWSDDFEVATFTLTKKIRKLGTQEAFEFYSSGQHLIRDKAKYKPKSKKIWDRDISHLEFNPDLHAERLLAQGLSYIQVANRINDAGLLN